MRQKRGKKKSADKVFKFTPANGAEVTIGDGGAHRELNAETLATAAEDQDKWAAKAESPFVQESPQLAAFIRARRQVPEWRQSVEIIKTDLKSRSITTEQRAFLKERLGHFETVLAETLAIAGEFAEAAKVHPNLDMRKEYKRIIHAIEKPDDQECECGQTNPNLLTKEGVVKWVWSEKHRLMMPIVVCHHCGDWNVKPETNEMSRLSGLRRQAEAMTKGMTPKDARQRLEQASHATLKSTV